MFNERRVSHKKHNNSNILYIMLIFFPLVNYSACTINATQLDFGNYKPFDNANLDTHSNITVRCDSYTFVTVSLSTGNSGTYTNRLILSNSFNLSYNLYQNSGRTHIWGDGTGNTRTVTKFVRRNRNTTYSVYGRIPGSQSVPPGIYTDNIIAEASF